jgi:hypothetical protein
MDLKKANNQSLFDQLTQQNAKFKEELRLIELSMQRMHTPKVVAREKSVPREKS